jgi:hypothetical protein
MARRITFPFVRFGSQVDFGDQLAPSLGAQLAELLKFNREDFAFGQSRRLREAVLRKCLNDFSQNILCRVRCFSSLDLDKSHAISGAPRALDLIVFNNVIVSTMMRSLIFKCDALILIVSI